jgi:hypothetical protein
MSGFQSVEVSALPPPVPHWWRRRGSRSLNNRPQNRACPGEKAAITRMFREPGRHFAGEPAKN